MKERTLSGYFCDDIRQEVDGKMSLIGCYGPEMVVPSFPVTLSKLCAVVKVCSRDGLFEKLRVMVLKGDDEIAAAEIPQVALAQMKKASDESQDPIKDVQHTIAVNFVMSPVTIDSPVALRVRALADGQLIKGLSLKVTSTSSGPSVGGIIEETRIRPKRKKVAE